MKTHPQYHRAAHCALALLLVLPGGPAQAAGGITDPTATPTPASLPLQPVGKRFVDPVFNTTLRRVSNRSESGGFETHIYSQLQAFSTDNAYVLLTTSVGYVVRRVKDFTKVTGFNTLPWNCPRWHPTRPHVIVHYDSNEDTTVRVQYTNVDTGKTTTVFTFPSQYLYIRVNQSFDELSRDGRWMSGMVTNSNGRSVIFALDLQEKRLGAVLPLSELYSSHGEPDPVYGEIDPDWIGVSPLGNYLMIQWERDNDVENPVGCSGLESWNISTGEFVGYASAYHQHGDLGLLANGETEVFVGYDVYHPSGNLAIGYHVLPGNTGSVSPTNYMLVYSYGAGAGHISCQGPPGTSLVSFGSTDLSDGSDPFEGEIAILRFNGSVRRLVHFRSSVCGYWVQPRASMSADGRYAIFASDWGTQTGEDSCGSSELGEGDPYILDLSAGDKKQPDLLIKRGNQTESSFAVNNVYQGAPSGEQIESQSIARGSAATYQVRIQNDLTSARGFILKAAENAVSNWNVTYSLGSQDITNGMKSKWGWETGPIPSTGNKTITVRITPNNSAATGSSKQTTIKSYLDNSDTTGRDAVRAAASLQ